MKKYDIIKTNESKGMFYFYPITNLSKSEAINKKIELSKLHKEEKFKIILNHLYR